MNPCPPRHQRGIALVIVLVFLVLLSVFIVGFFSNSQDELVAAQSFTGEISASHLAESAVSVVMSQIREATGRVNGAWASQPGMIRVYRDGDSASAKADAFFKLYSSDDMLISGREITNYDPTKEIPEGPAGWSTQPALWTNLNAPVQVTIPNSKNTALRYPILDPFLDQLYPEGLEFIDTKQNEKEKARMPVRWLYVLKDGTLTAPTRSKAEGTQAEWAAGERAPTASNPIVGRIAFWTDDECCKVNINTAGGYSLLREATLGDGGMPRQKATNAFYTEDDYAGSFWDAPRAFTDFERGVLLPTDATVMAKGGLGLSQPVRGEYERYPGHPATTSLGILFRGRKTNASQTAQDAPYTLTSGQLALLTPRLQYSLVPSNKERCSSFGTERLISKLDDAPGPRVKRLYASVDELFYAQPNPKDIKNEFRVQSEVDLNVAKANDQGKILTPELLERMRFFLTAHSRAPEMNLFGRPRVTMWPVFSVAKTTDENDWWNPSDRLLAFCSTIGPQASSVVPQANVTRFLFQRQHEDPTTGAKSGAYSPTVDIDLPRNQALIKYLQDVTNNPFPGFGGPSFKAKYAMREFGKPDGAGDPLGRDQILVEIFDYIRTVNLRDSTRDRKYAPLDSDGYAHPTAAQIKQLETFKYAPRGLVIPASLGSGDSKRVGFGRFPTVSEAALVLYHSGYKAANGQRYFLLSDIPSGVRPTHNLVRAFLVFETFNAMHGFAPTMPANASSNEQRKLRFEVTDLNNFTLDFGTGPQSLRFRNSGFNEYNYVNVDGTRNSGGTEGFLHTLQGKNSDVSTSANWYQFQSEAEPNQLSSPGLPSWIDPNKPSGIEIPVANTTAILSEVTARLTIKFDRIDIHTINFRFPQATVPIPQDLVWAAASAYPAGTDVSTGDPGGFLHNTNPGSNWASTKAPGVNRRQVKTFAGRLSWVGNGDSTNRTDPNFYRPPGSDSTSRWRNILQPGDVVRSVIYGKGDLRAACLTEDDTVFQPHPDYLYQNSLAGAADTSKHLAHAQTLRKGDGGLYFGTNGSVTALFPGGARTDGLNDTNFGNIAKIGNKGGAYPATQAADIPFSINGVVRNDGKLGDYDNGLGNLGDGPYCNKADEGNLAWRYEVKQLIEATPTAVAYYVSYDPKKWSYQYPYYTWVYDETYETFFTPNRQVPSAGLFGSLLSGKDANWQTLCFCPNPAGNTGAATETHPGRKIEPKDYLWLDLFTMPVVEPYAISEPFSTAGKINLNYQIVPFANIKRSTGMRAALQPVRVMAMPVVDVLSYKTGVNSLPKPNTNYRYVVDRDETLKAIDAYFDGYSADHNSGLFKSAAQICDFYLYPKQRADPAMQPQVDTRVKYAKGEAAIRNWWTSQGLTGDNVREKPYADLYPRLTTKSNTYCVHIRAQALRQTASPDPAKAEEHFRTWDENRDRVIGEYRGSSIIERYIDPQDERFSPTGDRLTRINVDRTSLDDAYRFRILNTKRFDP